MEGFNAAQFNEILGLEALKLKRSSNCSYWYQQGTKMKHSIIKKS
jgi:hypothetical protein